jgi:magnesium chelatase family protein
MPDISIQESRERVQSAIRNAGLSFRRKRIRVNLVPATIRKRVLSTIRLLLWGF